MSEQLLILNLITNASLLVQIVMGFLLLFSIISWGIIFSKYWHLKQAKKLTLNFVRLYNNSNSISTLYTQISSISYKQSIISIFYNAIVEYNKLNQNGVSDKETIIVHLERSISGSLDQEMNDYEDQLSLLATFASVSPYIGLFGTVWGIMHAFIALGSNGSASLAAVAPGIAEALITTAMGLLVAIPAYIAYNKFSADVSFLYHNMTKFGDDFLNLISRKLNLSRNQGLS